MAVFISPPRSPHSDLQPAILSTSAGSPQILCLYSITSTSLSLAPSTPRSSLATLTDTIISTLSLPPVEPTLPLPEPCASPLSLPLSLHPTINISPLPSALPTPSSASISLTITLLSPLATAAPLPVFFAHHLAAKYVKPGAITLLPYLTTYLAIHVHNTTDIKSCTLLPPNPTSLNITLLPAPPPPPPAHISPISPNIFSSYAPLLPPILQSLPLPPSLRPSLFLVPAPPNTGLTTLLTLLSTHLSASSAPPLGFTKPHTTLTHIPPNTTHILLDNPTLPNPVHPVIIFLKRAVEREIPVILGYNPNEDWSFILTFFKDYHVSTIPPPNTATIANYLARLTRLPPDSLSALAGKCDGFTLSDVVACIRKLNGVVTNGELERVVAQHVPIGVGGYSVKKSWGGWGDWYGGEGARLKVERNVLGCMRGEGGIEAPGGIVIHGGSGTGKSLLAYVIAGCLNWRVMVVTAGDLYDKYLGESERRMREVFEKAREVGNVVVVLDGLEVICGTRESSGVGVESRVLSTLLNELDGVDTGGECGVVKNVLVVGIAKDLSKVDKAVLREGRLAERIEVGGGGVGDVEAMLRGMNGEGKKEEEGEGIDVTFDGGIGWDKLAALAVETADEEVVGADLRVWLGEAERRAVKGGRKVVEEADFIAVFDDVFGSN